MSFEKMNPYHILPNPGEQKICKCGEPYYDATGLYRVCPDCYFKKDKEVKKAELEVKSKTYKEQCVEYLTRNNLWSDYFNTYDGLDRLVSNWLVICPGLFKELNKMSSWCLENNKKYKKWEKFIGNWLRRSA